MADLTFRSVSQLTSWVRCSEGYRLEKIARAPKRPAAWLAQGIAFHSTAEVWEASLRTITEDDLVMYYLTEYDRIIAESSEREPDLKRWMTGGRTKTTDDIERRRERGSDMVVAYLRYAEQAPERVWPYMGEEVATEVEFELDLAGLMIKGYIDQILIWPDGRLTVRDLKTGSKRPDSAFQLGVYALAVEQDYGTLPRWGDFYMLKDGKPDSRVDLSLYTRERVTRWFHSMDAAVKAGVFIPNPGDACRTCAVSDYCPVMGSRSAEYEPTTEGQS